MYRRNLKHSRVKNLFKFASPKMDRVMTVESSLEFDACFHLEYCLDIDSFEAQPEGYHYEYHGKTLSYTPDFLVADRINGHRFIEVKPASKVISTEFRNKFAAKREAASDYGIELVLVTDRQIRVNPILNNLKLLHRYSGVRSFTPLHLKLLELVKSTGAVKLESLVRETGEEKGLVLSHTLAWISKGELKVDLAESPLGFNSVVWF